MFASRAIVPLAVTWLTTKPGIWLLLRRLDQPRQYWWIATGSVVALVSALYVLGISDPARGWRAFAAAALGAAAVLLAALANNRTAVAVQASRGYAPALLFFAAVASAMGGVYEVARLTGAFGTGDYELLMAAALAAATFLLTTGALLARVFGWARSLTRRGLTALGHPLGDRWRKMNPARAHELLAGERVEPF